MDEATLTRPAQTAAYAPSIWIGSRLGQLLDGRPRFTWLEVERMRWTPQIQFGLRILRAPLFGVTWKVDSESDKVSRWIDREVHHIWKRMLPRLCRIFEYGVATGEVLYARDKHRHVHFEDFLEVHPRDARPIYFRYGRKAGKPAGIEVHQVAGQGKILLDARHGFWCKGEAEYGEWYGRPRLAGSYEPWYEKCARHGANDMRHLFYKKAAFKGPSLRYPIGFQNLAKPGQPDWLVSNQDIARELVEKFETGGVMALPNVQLPNGGGPAWAWEDPKSFGDMAGLLDYPKQLDKEILIGMGIPPELVDASTVGSGYSGRAIPAQMFFTSMDEMASLFMHTIDQQIMRWLVKCNFGNQGYEIKLDSLAALVSRDPAAAGASPGQPAPQGQPAQPGGGVPYVGKRGGHGVQDPKTGRIRYDGHGHAKRVKMSLAKPLSNSDAASLWNECRGPVLVPLARARLSFNETEHPRGQPENAGEFAPKNTGKGSGDTEDKGKGEPEAWDGKTIPDKDVEWDGKNGKAIRDYDTYDEGGEAWTARVFLQEAEFTPPGADDPIKVYRWSALDGNSGDTIESGEWTTERVDARSDGRIFAEENHQEPPVQDDYQPLAATNLLVGPVGLPPPEPAPYEQTGDAEMRDYFESINDFHDGAKKGGWRMYATDDGTIFAGDEVSAAVKERGAKTLGRDMEKSFGVAADETRAFLHAIGEGDNGKYNGERCADAIMKAWATSSNSDLSAACQIRAEKLFGLSGVYDSGYARTRSTELADEHAAVIDAFLKATYHRTQERFEDMNVSGGVTLYRGMVDEGNDFETDESGTAKVSLQPMSSFSLSYKTSRSFAGTGDEGRPVMMAVTVPKERLLSMPGVGYGCLNEGEFIVLGGGYEAKAAVSDHDTQKQFWG